jgi:hypothetical protein
MTSFTGYWLTRGRPHCLARWLSSSFSPLAGRAVSRALGPLTVPTTDGALPGWRTAMVKTSRSVHATGSAPTAASRTSPGPVQALRLRARPVAEIDQLVGGPLNPQPLGKDRGQQQPSVRDGSGSSNAISTWSKSTWEDRIEKVPPAGDEWLVSQPPSSQVRRPFHNPDRLSTSPHRWIKAKKGRAWYAWRRTVTGWCFAIGAAGPPPDRWEYDGPEPPGGFPSKGRGWGDKANRNWTVREEGS